MKLHHFAYNITPNNLELVIELFKKFNCTISYREKDARWCMLEQKPLHIDIQIIESKHKPIKKNNNTHIAFLSDNPKEEIKKIQTWAEDKNIKFKQGQWSNRELWFDLPDIFTNFVIEVMHTSIIE